MIRFDRRRFLQTSLGCAGAALFDRPESSAQADAEERRRKLPVAAVVTEYRPQSHADVIVGKILEGFRQDGGPGPDLELVAMFVDQFPAADMSRRLAAQHGFRITNTIEEAITLGRGKIEVAGVLSIGEHGNYPSTPDTKQVMYPRKRFFDEIAATFRKFGKVVPVFNDKHLSYSWADAKAMYDTAQQMRIPFMAGSSIPVAWRSPPLTLPKGCELSAALGIGYGGLEAYGFHALEGFQAMVERRRGGETGVAAVQAVRGDRIQEARNAGRWSGELLDALLDVIPAPPAGRPTEMSPESVFYLLEYRDGLQGAIAMETNLAHQFGFAGRLKGESKPQATWIRLQDGKPYSHFEFLLRAVEEMVHSGKPSYPVERTLLTTGVLDAVMHSVANGGERIETPHLAISYAGSDWPFAQGAPPS